MKNETVPKPSGNRTQSDLDIADTLQTLSGQSAKTAENSENPQVEQPTGTVGHSGTDQPPQRDRCGICDATLNPHNVTGLCAECKLIARNARLAGTIGSTWNSTIAHLRGERDPMVLADAIALVVAELKANLIHATEVEARQSTKRGHCE